jgi:hypothetical protein
LVYRDGRGITKSSKALGVSRIEVDCMLNNCSDSGGTHSVGNAERQAPEVVNARDNCNLGDILAYVRSALGGVQNALDAEREPKSGKILRARESTWQAIISPTATYLQWGAVVAVLDRRIGV